MSGTTYVPEYRDELSRTGYPLSAFQPLTADSGYTLPPGFLEDASIYIDDTESIPYLSQIDKSGNILTFHIPPYAGAYDMVYPSDVIELYDNTGMFGGILVPRIDTLKMLGSWTDSSHVFKNKIYFCLRCVEIFPNNGVMGLVDDNNDKVTGNVIIAGASGTILNLQDNSTVTVNYVGDPTLSVFYDGSRQTEVPLKMVNVAGLGSIVPDDSRNIQIVAKDLEYSNLHVGAFRINTSGNAIRMAIAGAD